MGFSTYRRKNLARIFSRTVIGTTIPHLREERLKQIAIPILSNEIVTEITQHIKTAFNLKAKRKKLILEVLHKLDEKYEKYKY
jgi:restriction endonuclease S subunit